MTDPRRMPRYVTIALATTVVAATSSSASTTPRTSRFMLSIRMIDRVAPLCGLSVAVLGRHFGPPDRRARLHELGAIRLGGNIIRQNIRRIIPGHPFTTGIAGNVRNPLTGGHGAARRCGGDFFRRKRIPLFRKML